MTGLEIFKVTVLVTLTAIAVIAAFKLKPKRRKYLR